MNSIIVPVSRVEEALRKIQGINRRAEKNGLKPIAISKGPVVTVKEPRHPSTHPWYRAKDLVERRYMTLNYTTDAVVIEGYSPVATLEYEHAEPTIYEWPGETLPEAMRLVNGTCAHCQTDRWRKRVFILRHDSTGVVINVGSTCVRDFLGYDPAALLAQFQALRRMADLVDEDWDGMKVARGREAYDLPTLLAYTVGVIRTKGWTSKGKAEASGYELIPTSGYVAALWSGKWDRKSLKDVGLEKMDLSKTALKAYGEEADWVLRAVQEHLPNNSVYEQNLRVIAAAGWASRREFGLAVSMVNFAQRLWEREVQASIDAVEVEVSEYVGEVGDKVSLQVELDLIRAVDTRYGVSWLTKFKTEEGSVLTWFASNKPAVEREGMYHDVEVGDRVLVSGRVRDHKEYQGHKETNLTRCKLAYA